MFCKPRVLRFVVSFLIISLVGCHSQTNKHQFSSKGNQLWVLPDDGMSPIIQTIDKAQSSIDLVIYGFTSNQVAKALIRAKERGVAVKLLIERAPYKAVDENHWIVNRLKKNGIKVKDSSSQFAFTHQKTLVLDKKEAIVMTGNFTKASTTERNFGLITHNSAAINEILRGFNADWDRKKFSPRVKSLVWSPNNSTTKLVDLISSAKKRIEIYNQEMGSYVIGQALKNAAKRGVNVEFLLPLKRYSVYQANIDSLVKDGVHVRLPKTLYIHAKAILVDDGLPDQRTFVGSINFSCYSLNKNRELGMVVSDQNVAQRMQQVFQHDWKAANKVNAAQGKAKVSTRAIFYTGNTCSITG
jgi:cardiolipin synthase A/B